MGLGTFKSGWQRQTLHFGHERGTTYSVLSLDNRGMGDSDAPLMRYSTSEMARDAVEVLEHIGWLPANSLSLSSSSSSLSRSLHVIGISMGGMIAQELACLLPGAISSLNLVSTAANIENTTTFWENMANRAQLLVPKSIEASVRGSARNMFPLAFLAGKDETHLPDRRTPGVLPPFEGRDEGEYLRFNSNWERFVAGEMHKRLDPTRFTTKGFLLQLVAAGWHHKSRQQLAAMADAVGRERILVMHGTADRMISIPHGRKLGQHLAGEGLTVHIREGMGHAPPIECFEWFHKEIEERVGKAEELDGRKVG